MEAVDKAAQEYRRILESAAKDAKRRLEQLLEDYDSDSDKANIVLKRKILADIERELRANGFEPAGATLTDSVQAVIENAVKDLRNQGILANASGISPDAIKNYVKAIQSDALVGGKDALAGVSDILSKLLTGGETRIGLYQRVASAIDGTVANAVSIVDANLSGIYRQTTLQMSAAVGITTWKYGGPVDKWTRDFCAVTLINSSEGYPASVYTAADIDRLRNDTGPQPPSLYGGGWNCRHRWQPWVNL